jgi:hypothetical protein
MTSCRKCLPPAPGRMQATAQPAASRSPCPAVTGSAQFSSAPRPNRRASARFANYYAICAPPPNLLEFRRRSAIRSMTTSSDDTPSRTSASPPLCRHPFQQRCRSAARRRRRFGLSLNLRNIRGRPTVYADRSRRLSSPKCLQIYRRATARVHGAKTMWKAIATMRATAVSPQLDKDVAKQLRRWQDRAHQGHSARAAPLGSCRSTAASPIDPRRKPPQRPRIARARAARSHSRRRPRLRVDCRSLGHAWLRRSARSTQMTTASRRCPRSRARHRSDPRRCTIQRGLQRSQCNMRGLQRSQCNMRGLHHGSALGCVAYGARLLPLVAASTQHLEQACRPRSRHAG